MKYLAIVSRIIVGAVFIFSGFVKAVDPLGSAYKFIDYFAAFNLTWLNDFAVILGVALSAIEFLIGAALFVGVRTKIASWLALLFMAFFTPLTLYLAVNNPVSDCGCFGDAIIMTNWQTFYKNLIIIAFTIIAFLWRKKFKPLMSCKKEWIVVFLLALIPVGISIYGLRHLPIIDFRPWKVGSSMKIEGDVEDKYYVTYKNKETGETKEYLSPNFPWDDSTWVANWEFVDQRIEAVPFPETYIYMGDADGQDYFKDYTQHSDFQFLLIMYYIEDACLKHIEEIKNLSMKSFENNIGLVGITGSTPEVTNKFIQDYQIPFDIYYSDEITLKTIVRANPGLVLIKEGVVLKKWNHRDIPEFDEIEFDKLAEKYITSE
jgi:uncharacterized membrane protein YphA (DoxX/SURF4 family)